MCATSRLACALVPVLLVIGVYEQWVSQLQQQCVSAEAARASVDAAVDTLVAHQYMGCAFDDVSCMGPDGGAGAAADVARQFAASTREARLATVGSSRSLWCSAVLALPRVFSYATADRGVVTVDPVTVADTALRRAVSGARAQCECGLWPLWMYTSNVKHDAQPSIIKSGIVAVDVVADISRSTAFEARFGASVRQWLATAGTDVPVAVHTDHAWLYVCDDAYVAAISRHVAIARLGLSVPVQRDAWFDGRPEPRYALLMHEEKYTIRPTGSCTCVCDRVSDGELHAALQSRVRLYAWQFGRPIQTLSASGQNEINAE
jgi:hypothetical protein